MDTLRLNHKDGIFIAVCLVIIAVGLVVGVRYFHKAFPEASIDFRLNRSQSEDVARQFLADQNLTPPDDYRHAGRFGYDSQAKTYLEKELGVDGARAYLGHPIHLWYWQHRWFQSSKKEEFSVFVTPEGEIARMSHDVAEADSGADLPEDDARALADSFLFGVMKKDSAQMTFIESDRTGRPARSDWTFTFKAKGIEPVAGSEYRYEVGIIGDRIGSYREFLHVPEAWQASFKKLRSYNEMAGNFSGVGFLLTALAMIAIIFIRIRRRAVQWKTALGFGLVAVALSLLNQINNFSQGLYWYDTTSSWSGFLLEEILFGFLSALGMGLVIFLLTAAAETMYRERYADKVAMPRLFTARALRTKSAFKNILLGVTLTAFFFAYQIVFYLVAGKFGAWSPSDVPYDNLLNTAMPWLAVLAIGFFPAVSEEFMSRMFSIPFLQKAFRNRMTWLALLIPALIWGFGHAGYPNQPFWIRGAEVGFAGIIIGIIMLRFGILACLVWHYTVDALYTAFLLFRSENPYFVITAAVATGLLIIPLLVAWIAYLRKGAFLPETGLLNSDIAAPVTEPATPAPAPVTVEYAEAVHSQYMPLSTKKRVLCIVLLGAGIVAALVPVSKIGDFLKYPVPRDQAIRIFADTLRATGWADPDTLQIGVVESDAEQGGVNVPFVYLLKQEKSVAKFNELADKKLLKGCWWVYGLVPENRLRFGGVVHARTGLQLSLSPQLPEELPGDSLSEDSARILVETVLAEQGEDLSHLTMKEHNEVARPHRLDHTFVYEAVDGDPRNIGEAKYRRMGFVYGNLVSVYARPFYKVPEEWQRDRRATTAIRAVVRALRVLAIVGLAIWAAFLLASLARRGQVPWKKAFLIAIIPTAVVLLSRINEFYLQKAEYFWQVSQPWSVFRTSALTATVMSLVSFYAMTGVALALIGGLYKDRIASLVRHERRAAWIDSIFAVGVGIAIVLLIRSIQAWLNAAFPSAITFTGWGIPDWIATSWPFFSLTADAAIKFLIYLASFAIFSYLWNGPARRPLLRLLLIAIAILALIPSGAVEPNEWLLAVVTAAVTILLIFGTLKFIVSGRAVLLISAVAGASVFSLATQALSLGNDKATAQGWLFVVIAAAVFLVWILPRARQSVKPGPVSESGQP